MKSVTILIAVMNMKNTIKECIDSVLECNYLSKKIMVVDGFSNDGTFEILQKYGNKIDVFRVKGIVPIAWNFGLNKINTDYVAFTDADCIVDKNWLKELVFAIDKPDIVASAGFCGTPTSASNLQKIIGKELENRFNRFPKYIRRAPTMNLCVRAEMAQKVRFNSKMITGSENLFGYEVTKFGKMIYNPKAKVWHNHRSTWKGFFRQQKNYAMWWFIMYPMNSRKKHGGDHISTNRMILQVPLLEGIIALMFLAIFIEVLIYPALMLLAILSFMYFAEFLSMGLPVRLYPLAFVVYFVRSFAFVVGSIKGLIYTITNKHKIHKI